MVTFDMLKRANQAGLNMVISHEDTFWNDRDDTKDLTSNPLYRMKTEYVKQNGMIFVFSCFRVFVATHCGATSAVTYLTIASSSASRGK